MTALPTSIDPQLAARMLERWGFLAHSDLPDREGPSWLLVAIRPRPTLEHFDPEEVDYWVTDAGRGQPAALGRMSPLPIDTNTAWGMVRVTDRFRETNEWFSFGGRLQAERVDDTIVAVFTSSAPLLRRGGHSQGWDLGAPSVGAFLARVRGVAGSDARFEALVARADPRVRFGCFVAHCGRRYRQSEVLRKLDTELWRLIQHEEHRLREADPATWDAGLRLLEALDRASVSQLMGDAPHAL